MKKLVLSAIIGSALAMPSIASANSAEGVGVAVNYGLISGPTLELSYPFADTLQVRGALSGGMGLSESTNDTDIAYDVKADGGINRLSIDYHPFENGFFLSGGYAVNSFKLTSTGTSTGPVTIGDTAYDDSNAKLKGLLDWNNGTTLSLGWGHSPSEGFGFLIEVGAIFTGAADVSLSGTGTVTKDGSTYDVSTEIQDALNKEEAALQADVGDYDFLPILQAGITYRF